MSAENIDEQTGNIIYDIIHKFDDIYVYSRTFLENNYINLADTNDYNLVYPNIYISNYSTTTNKELLKNLGITDIITALPKIIPPYPDDFNYLHIPVYDDSTENISMYFDKVYCYISEILQKKGKILLHCMVGRSRSVTLFIAFLIHILKGDFNQSLVNIEESDAICTLEYEKYRIKNNSIDGVQPPVKKEKNIEIVHDFYSTPVNILENNATIAMRYKKQKMLNDVKLMIEKYDEFVKEMNTVGDCVGNPDDMVEFKKKFARDFINANVLKYVQNYRSIAEPNENFIDALTEYILQ